MKALISICLALMHFCALAQEQPSVDSIFIQHDGTQFFQVHVQSYESGRSITERTPLGRDTSVAVNAIVGLVYPGLQQFARDAVSVARIARVRSTIGSASSALMGVHGRNYFLTMAIIKGPSFIGSYRLRINGGAAETCNVSQLANGSLRFQRQQGATFVMDVITDRWIRLRDFDGNNILDLYYDADRQVWISLDLRYNLTRI